jgi:hypothetical protein
LSDKVLELSSEISERLLANDPTGGRWNVSDARICRAWCDASSLALGATLEVDGDIVEDAAWLRKADDASHINLAELESVIKGLNLAVSWEMRQVKIMTDSATVFGWLQSLIVGDKPIRVKGLGEALARRRLALIRDTIAECGLQVSATLVPSAGNKSEILTRVPRRWLQTLRAFHARHHFGVDRTLYLARICFPDQTIPRSEVENVVRDCLRCKSIDPAPIHWEPGAVEVELNWWRVACDVTHFQGDKFLTLVDCGPSRFALWRQLPDERVASVARHLQEIFRERGPPWQILFDNAASFRSVEIANLCQQWGTRVIFRCAHRPSGNGIVERNHRTIKRMAARSGGSVLDMVFWYNLSPKSGVRQDSVPSRSVSAYDWKPPSVSLDEAVYHQPDLPLGTEVLVKPAGSRCTEEWRRGQVTGHARENAVEVDGTNRHVADIRVVASERPSDTQAFANNQPTAFSGREVRESTRRQRQHAAPDLEIRGACASDILLAGVHECHRQSDA